MANYSLVSTTKFQPFSFERYMQPLQIYSQLYERQEAMLDALDEKASKWEMLANMAGNEKAYSRYKAYADKLRAEADQLSAIGLTPNSRRSIRELSSRYRTDVQPIEQAYNRWQELEKEQRVYRANSNFNVAFDNDYSTMRLDDLIANPNQSYTAINGDDVVNRTSALAKQALQSIIDDPEIDNAYRGLLKVKMQSGATLEELNRALEMGLEPGQTGDRAVDALLQVARTVNEAYKGNAAYDKDFMWRNISQGLYGGVGTTSYSIQQDPGYLDPARAYQLEVTRKSMQPVQMANGVTYDPVHSMYYKTENGKKVYYSYDPNLYSSGETTLDPGVSANYNVGDIIPSTTGGAPSMVVKKDSKTGAVSVSALSEVEGHPGIYTDRKGHFYTSDGKLTQNPLSGSGNGSTNIPNAPNYTPLNFKGWSNTSTMVDKRNNSGFWGNIGGSGRMQDDDIEEALGNPSVVIRVKRYIGQLLDRDESTIGDEAAKLAVRRRLVDICRDRDWISNNEYQVRIAGVDKNGDPETGESSNVKDRVKDIAAIVSGNPQTSGQPSSTKEDKRVPK